MENLLQEIRACQLCKKFLPNEPRPILQASTASKILIIGQAPGAKVQATGIPWDDKSGNNLRNWLGIDELTFYNPDLIALVPMGFCYPGTGKTGDLPPRPECAPLWHLQLFAFMPQVKLILLIGQFAQNYYLGDTAKDTLTDTVNNFHAYLPRYFPLPHPSPRNNIWQAKNTWFVTDVLPELKKQVQVII